MTAFPRPRPERGVLAAALPITTAIGVFGVVYGPVARPVLGATTTVLSSLLLFSGAAQFTMVALLASGATAAAVLGAVTMLAVRHLPRGAVLRPRMSAVPARRAAFSLFLTDETTGMALTHDDPVERTLLISGLLAYVAFAVGTAIGMAGGNLAAIEPRPATLFPVLFIGLAALLLATAAITVGSRVVAPARPRRGLAGYALAGLVW